jgi:hypothetical protein
MYLLQCNLEKGLEIILVVICFLLVITMSFGKIMLNSKYYSTVNRAEFNRLHDGSTTNTIVNIKPSCRSR